MRRQDLLSILLTFVMGFGVGMYVYITGFAGFLTTVTGPGEKDTYSYVIVADAYGGCNRATVCPSFRIDSTGDYKYIFPTNDSVEPVTREGRLPYGMRQELENAITTRALVAQSQTITPAMCDSYADGIDVKYTITLPEGVYELDSCGTAVDAESNLWRAVSGIWDYLQAN